MGNIKVNPPWFHEWVVEMVGKPIEEISLEKIEEILVQYFHVLT